jgi:hypothetical protein
MGRLDSHLRAAPTQWNVVHVPSAAVSTPVSAALTSIVVRNPSRSPIAPRTVGATSGPIRKSKGLQPAFHDGSRGRLKGCNQAISSYGSTGFNLVSTCMKLVR